MTREQFLKHNGTALTGMLLLNNPLLAGLQNFSPADDKGSESTSKTGASALTLFLCGDVMTGRGIDQVLPYSVSPELKERFVKDAREYVKLAEKKHGEIPGEVSYKYIWGDALKILSQANTDVRIINLETAVTTNIEYWPRKGVHYRMHPKNTPLFKTAGIDVCILGNNHVLDFGYAGLRETLNSLHEGGIKTAGAGINRNRSSEPAIINTNSGRLLIFSYGSTTSGVPGTWEASQSEAGVNLLTDLTKETSRQIIDTVERYRKPKDRVLISIHWGSNWGYQIPPAQKEFAHRLIDEGAADIIHGHSSHHPKGIEVYKKRPIIYGAGDLINDYEGIGGRAKYRDDLSLMYFPKLDASGVLQSLKMKPMHIKQFQLGQATEEETEWLTDMLDRECNKLGSSVNLQPDGYLELKWN